LHELTRKIKKFAHFRVIRGKNCVNPIDPKSLGYNAMFRQLPATRFDLKFSIFGFPVRVHPMFWVIGILFGASSGSVAKVAIWVAVLFVSILLHELGHSLMMRQYGVDSYIVLHHMGGLAVPTSSRRMSLGWLEQIAISLAGPFAGFIFAGIVTAVVKFSGGFISINLLFGFIPVPSAFLFDAHELVNTAIGNILWVNTFWGLINLLPVFPLDGGRVSQQIFTRFDPWNGYRNALWLSVIVGGLTAVAAYAGLRSTYMAFLFGLLNALWLSVIVGGLTAVAAYAGLRSTYMAFLFGLLALQSYQMIQGGAGSQF
jgi:Zn-dependent protease